MSTGPEDARGNFVAKVAASNPTQKVSLEGLVCASETLHELTLVHPVLSPAENATLGRLTPRAVIWELLQAAIVGRDSSAHGSRVPRMNIPDLFRIVENRPRTLGELASHIDREIANIPAALRGYDIHDPIVHEGTMKIARELKDSLLRAALTERVIKDNTIDAKVADGLPQIGINLRTR